MSRTQSWHDVTEGMHTRLSKWKLKTLSIGGRLTLLKSVLGAIPIYHMSIFKVPMKVLQNIESIRTRFFNGADVNYKKPSWVRWKSVLAAKDVGGLRVSSLFALNRALMFKWVWRFFSQKNSLWVRVVKALHGEDGKIGKKFYYSKLGNGVNTAFWDVAWCGDIAFKNLVPRLYALESMKNIEVISHGTLPPPKHRRARISVRPQTPMAASTQALIAAFAAGSPPFPLPPTSHAYDQAPLSHKEAMIRMRDDIPKEDMPPRRRFVLTAPLPGCDVAESSVIAAARAPRGQFNFVDTVVAGQSLVRSLGHDARTIARAADRAEDVGYVRALHASEHMMMTFIEEVNLRISYQAQVRRQESKYFYTQLHDAQTDRRDIRLEIDVVRGQRTAYETEL
nr:RNA-directed DNA polymerase, eukaryota [Tanacetum cinerariifolium]